MRTLINKFVSNKDGATMIEYGLIAALVAVALVGALGLLATDLSDLFGEVGAQL